MGDCDMARAERLQTDASDWHVPPDLLARGLISSGRPELWAPLRHRLAAREPVSILALGSSLVATAAGCNAPLPSLDGCACPRCCGTFCGQYGEGGGWAVELLEWVNHSWPHADHRLYNMGEPGADVIPTLLSCPQTLLGGLRPDLVLIDTTVNSPEHHERLLRLLLTQWSPPPAVVFTLFGEFTDRKETGRDGARARLLMAQLMHAAEAEGLRESGEAPVALARRIADALHAPPPRLNGVGWDGDALRVPDAWARSSFLGRTLSRWARAAQAKPLERSYLWHQYVGAAQVLRLQAAYGVGGVSALRAFSEEFESHAHGLHLRQWSCRDGLHPNGGRMAHRMMGELIAHAMATGFDKLAAAAAAAPPAAAATALQPVEGGADGADGAASAAGAAGAYVLPPPLGAQPRREGWQCFTFDEEGYQIMRGARRSNRMGHEHSVARVGLGPPPTLLEQSGWQFVVYEPLSRSSFKPGVAATSTGARLRLQVDASRVARPVVSLQYLTSYEHMGSARASCERCACEPARLDAHVLVRASTTAVHSFRVTPHPRCVISLVVLNATSSGEHKWKLERLLLESDLDY